MRFVLVDNQELSPTEYGVILLVHLAAPVLAAVGLTAVALEERRPQPEPVADEALSA